MFSAHRFSKGGMRRQWGVDLGKTACLFTLLYKSNNYVFIKHYLYCFLLSVFASVHHIFSLSFSKGVGGGVATFIIPPWLCLPVAYTFMQMLVIMLRQWLIYNHASPIHGFLKICQRRLSIQYLHSQIQVWWMWAVWDFRRSIRRMRTWPPHSYIDICWGMSGNCPKRARITTGITFDRSDRYM